MVVGVTLTSNISVKYITSVTPLQARITKHNTRLSIPISMVAKRTSGGTWHYSTSAKYVFKIFYFSKFNYQSSWRQKGCSRSWRNLQLSPKTIFETFRKSVSISFFTSFFREVPEGLTKKYRRIYAAVNHAGALTNILPSLNKLGIQSYFLI
jgi:hypothetical protein